MNPEKSMEYVFAYAKNGDEKVYDFLSTKSKEELSDISVQDITSSLQRFFQDKVLSQGIKSENSDEVSFDLVDLKAPLDLYRVSLVKEEREYKFIWSKDAYNQYK
ncbi:hypothetical protein M3210_03075 [Oceanobacillus luteolus]|uniref:hypothetical protein n=1 Tax=Oceanobacillus luteolus TaxID=1274358 RepID=UPI00204154D4|nr:hypothetical protein [Oceanobacillus luteolus]MCM3739246.1 hypothetical protein [Oceanobacillus luteolus]